MKTSPKMQRVNLYMPNPQMARLRKVSKRTGRSVSELVRQATEEYLERKAS